MQFEWTDNPRIRLAPRACLGAYVNKIVGDLSFVVHGINISTSGILVSRLIEPTASQPAAIRFQLCLPGRDQVISVAAHCVRSTDNGASGWEFVGLAPQDKEHISEFVEEVLRADEPSADQPA